MIPEKIRLMLGSGDVEEAQLGLTLLKEMTSSRDIPLILEEFLNPSMIYVKEEGIIHIKEYNDYIEEVWAMHKKVNTPFLKLSTIDSNVTYKDNDRFSWQIPLIK